MAEWLYEAGVGESRAALIEAGTIIEARIDREDGRARLGAVIPARLKGKASGGRAEVSLDGGGSAILSSLPPGLSEGAALLVEIVREAIPERGNPKLPLAKPADGPARPAPNLTEDLGGVRTLRPHEQDLLEQAGWSELLEQAATGLVPFPGGLLRIELTAAMTVIDVDGDLPPAELAIRGAAAAGQAIRRFAIAGSIGIDLPTLPDKAARLRASEAFDAALPQPFERTAVNGFGFLQIVRRRVRSSLLELIQSDSARAEAMALLRRLERGPPGGEVVTAAAPVACLLSENPQWLADLGRRRGGEIHVEAAALHP